MKKYILTPIAFFCMGLVFYIYYGLTWNAWMSNLPNLGIYAVILIALGIALKKKEEIRNRDY